MRIFIGCSTSHLAGINKQKLEPNTTVNQKKENSIAYQLNKKLKGLGHQTEPWWNTTNTIKDGEDFFEKIISLSKMCDAGIFILNDEMKLKDQTDNYKSVSNDNVYIELGMFIGSKGLQNVIFIVEKNVKIPSDFQAQNVLRYQFKSNGKTDDTSFAQIYNRVLERLQNIHKYAESDYVNGKLYFNYDTTDLILNKDKVTRSWNSKAAYLGFKAAKIWTDIELNPAYLPADFKYQFRNYLSKNERSLKEIQNIISLGSGIGTLDEEICRMIPFKGAIKYIPVEINPYLAVQAIERGIKSIINLKSTYAIIDDFESQTSQLKDFITNAIVRMEEKSLYVMLGGTFCNVDNQNEFLNNWSQIIDKNDYFLIDVFTKKDDDNYDSEDDLNERIKNEYTKRLINNAIEYKFETAPLLRKHDNIAEYLKLTLEERCNEMYDKFVDIEVKTTDNKSTLVIWRFKIDDDEAYKKNNTTTLFKVKRHSFENIKVKLNKYFEIGNPSTIKRIEISKHIDRSHFLLKKKEIK